MLKEEVREITDKLDSVGNTTAAMGKGFAIGSAALTALALFASYAQAVKLEGINLLEPLTLVGVLILVTAMFLGCKILKKQISFMVLLNVILSIVFILTIINVIAGILSLLSTVLASIITGIMAIASLLLIYEGLNEVISINGKEGLVLIISVFVVVIIIGFLIAAILI